MNLFGIDRFPFNGNDDLHFSFRVLDLPDGVVIDSRRVLTFLGCLTYADDMNATIVAVGGTLPLLVTTAVRLWLLCSLFRNALSLVWVFRGGAKAPRIKPDPDEAPTQPFRGNGGRAGSTKTVQYYISWPAGHDYQITH